MHILFLSDNFPPEVNAPASRTYEHCREWVAAGHQVTVVTCTPNFPKGRVFDGYRNRPWQVETVAGIRVIRVWSYITRNEGFAKRTLDYLSYMVTAFLASLFVRRVDVIVGTSPQFFTACAAWAVSVVKRRPWVFELRDLWPETIRAVSAIRNTAILDMLEKVELFLYRRADLIVSVTHAFRENLRERGIDPGKVEVVTNGCDLGVFRPAPRDEALARSLGLEGRFVAGYIGTHGLTHALETVVEAARILRDSDPADRFRILMLGDGATRPMLQEKAAALGLGNIVFVDTVPKAEVPKYWSLLDASIIHLKKTPLFTTVIPSKMFECMAMGIPILLGVEGEAAGILAREQAGLAIEPENARQLVDGIRRLEADPALAATFSANGVQGAARYDRKTLAAAMLGHLERLNEGRRRS